jgi:hypothetical protein
MTANRFHAKLNLQPHAVPLGVYEADGQSRPSDKFIVSRHRDNRVAARYGDISWDISSWHPEGRRTVMYFNFWKDLTISEGRDTLARDARWLIFSLIWLRDGPPFSNGTLMGYMFTIRSLILYSDTLSCRIQDVLANEAKLIEFSDSSCSGGRKVSLCGLLSHLERIGEELLGFSVVSEGVWRKLRTRAWRHHAEAKQTPPIPTRIYSKILCALSQELSEWEEVAPDCLEILRKCSTDLRRGRGIKGQQTMIRNKKLEHTMSPTWVDIAPSNVRAYLRKKGQRDDIAGLGGIVTQIQLVSKLTIQAFSGMRDDEALSLPFSCLETTVCRGRIQRLIQGRTTKLSRGPRKVCWVTNKEGQRAIEIAQNIAESIYVACGTSALPVLPAVNTSGSRPLFVSIAYSSLSGRRRLQPSDGHFFAGCLGLARFHRMRARLQPAIDNDDVIELEQIDEHRAWRAEECFNVGRPWTLETHQLRRSLAMYAQRSGLVTLQSLRRQLQHITDEMSRYYARGSEYARDLFGSTAPDAGHFCLEWQTTQVESETLSYASHVLFTDDTLFGGHAAFVQHRLKDKQGNISLQTRVETVQMFKRGELHYRETILGGCTKHGECESPAIDWLNLECIASNCSNMVGSLAKLETVIIEQARLVHSLPRMSLLYRTENANLEVLTLARDKVKHARTGNPT